MIKKMIPAGQEVAEKKDGVLVWNKKRKLCKIMNMFSSYCENVKIELNHEASFKNQMTDNSCSNSLNNWLKKSLNVLNKQYEMINEQHTDNIAYAAILYSSIKVGMSSSIFLKCITPLAKRKKVNIKEVRSGDSYALFREMVEGAVYRN